MTEEEWRTTTNPKAMLDWLRTASLASDRKLRLYRVACCRRARHALLDPRARAAIEVVERYADGTATEDDRRRAHQQAAAVGGPAGQAAKWAASASARAGAKLVTDAAGQTAACPPGQPYDPARWAVESQAQADLLRDLFGPNPAARS